MLQKTMESDNAQASCEMLENFHAAIEKMGLPVTKLTASDLQADLRSGALTYFQCCQAVANLYGTLKRELSIVKIFALDSSRIPFYAPNEPLFGAEVGRRFPSIAHDIEQGGKCYACDLTTAAAFHWIRTMEAGIRAMCRCLQIPDPTRGKDRNWSNISATLNAEIEKRWLKSTGRMSGDAQIFDKLYGAITGMLNPYRNETMHLDAKYTAPEALHSFELVKGLMQRIASRMDENGKPFA